MPLSNLQWSSLATCYSLWMETGCLLEGFSGGNVLSGAPSEQVSLKDLAVYTFFPDQLQLGFRFFFYVLHPLS